MVTVYILIILGFIGLLGLIHFKRKKVSNSSNLNEFKGVTIIIPFRNEEATLPKLMSDLEEQDWSRKDMFQIVFVDDHSEDNSANVVKALLEKKMSRLFSIDLIHLSDQDYGKKKAIQKAMDVAKYSHVQVLDADVRLTKRFINSVVDKIEKTKADFVIGMVQLKPSKSDLLNSFQLIEFRALNFLTESLFLLGVPALCNGANMLFNKAVFQKLNPYEGNPTDSGDDMFLLQKIIKAGHSVDLNINSDNMVSTCTLSSLHLAFSQRLRWASKWKIINLKRNTFLGIFVVLYSLVHLFIVYKYPLVYLSGTMILALILWLYDRLLEKSINYVEALLFYMLLPLYIPFFGIYSQLVSGVKWKGRMINSN